METRTPLVQIRRPNNGTEIFVSLRNNRRALEIAKEFGCLVPLPRGGASRLEPFSIVLTDEKPTRMPDRVSVLFIGKEPLIGMGYWRIDPDFVEVELPHALKRTRMMKELTEKNEFLERTLARSSAEKYGIAIQLAMKMLEVHDRGAYGHGARVATYAEALARAAAKKGAISLTDQELEVLRTAGLLHDTGKVSVPNQYLTKATRLSEECMNNMQVRIEFIKSAMTSRGASSEQIAKMQDDYAFVVAINSKHHIDGQDYARLTSIYATSYAMVGEKGLGIIVTPDQFESLTARNGNLTDREWAVLRAHPVESQRVLDIDWPEELRMVPEVARHHHEKLDGSGYPDGLTAAQLSVIERAIVISDMFDGDTAVDRPYRTYHSFEHGKEVLRSGAKEGKLDEPLVSAFLEFDIAHAVVASENEL